MKLRTKLLLGVGILLFAMAILMYILPTLFIRKDVFVAADAIHQLLISDHQEMVRSQEVWLNEVFLTSRENNNALLLMLSQEPAIASRLRISGNKPKKTVWNALASVASFDPDIGFAQLHAPEENKAAVISTDAANLYPIDHSTRRGRYTFLSLLPAEGAKGKKLFMGVPLPDEMQTNPGYTLLALIDPEKTSEQLPQVKEEIARLMPDFVGRKLSKKNLFASAKNWKDQSAYIWAIKIDLIRSLTPFYVEGLLLTNSQERVVPEGLARLDSTGNGYAILTSEIFSETPLFDDAVYYKLNQPTNPSSPSIALGSHIVTLPAKNVAFSANTLLLDQKNYLSIGSPLGFLGRQLALAANKMVFVRIVDFWMGFTKQGNQLPSEELTSFLAGADFRQKNGSLVIDNQTFYFSEITSFDEDQIQFFTLRPYEDEGSIVSTLLALEDKLSRRISMQLSLIALGTMILVLLFIGRIGFTVIYPVTKLARATEDVVAGRYEEVVLPEVGDRQDEVAILTRSFGEMVSGLQEREKIRGVLDKVVSKDVADEILKTQIHLGGEDRIVTMLFSDIRHFTTLTGSLSPQKTIHLLNACMTKVSRVIEGEGGVIDKYVGDEVMAIYGAPTTHPDHALRAVSSGMLIIETLKKWNKERVAAGEPALEMGIGVHTGLVVVGNMGAEDRLNYTVLGNNVNLAARLCEVAKPNQLIISAATLAEPNIKESFYVKPLALISLKGFVQPVKIFEVTGFKWEETQEGPPDDAL